MSLHPGIISRDVPVGENPAKVPTFLNQFMKAGGNYLATDFRTLGWVSAFKQHWWSSLTLYVLEAFKDNLKRLGLHEAIRVTCFLIDIKHTHFLCYPRDVLSGVGDIFHTSWRAWDGVARDVRSIKPPNGFSTL